MKRNSTLKRRSTLKKRQSRRMRKVRKTMRRKNGGSPLLRQVLLKNLNSGTKKGIGSIMKQKPKIPMKLALNYPKPPALARSDSGPNVFAYTPSDVGMSSASNHVPSSKPGVPPSLERTD